MGGISDGIDSAEGAIGGAIQGALGKTPAGKVVGDAAAGAVSGAAGAAVAAEAVQGVFLAASSVAAATGGVGVVGATAAATAGAITSAGIAIGSAIPVPLLGSLIGAIVGGITALVVTFNNRPSPDFARALLAVFRTYPNVLREWIDERETFGIPHDHSALRSRWGYVSMLREVAGEKGPDPFDDDAWRTQFEAGTVDPKPSAKPPVLADLGIKPTRDQVSAAAADIRVLTNGIPGLITNVTAVSKPPGLKVTSQLAVSSLSKTAGWKPMRTFLYAYDDKVPVFIDFLPPVVLQPDAQAQAAAASLKKHFGDASWVRGFDVVSAEKGQYVVRARVSAAAPKTVTARTMSLWAGVPVSVVVVDPLLAGSSANAGLPSAPSRAPVIVGLGVLAVVTAGGAAWLATRKTTALGAVATGCPECGKRHTKFPDDCYARATNAHNMNILGQSHATAEWVASAKRRRDIMKDYVSQWWSK